MSFVGASFPESFRATSLRLVVGAVALAAAGFAPAQAGETVLYRFQGGNDGCRPRDNLIFNNGELYGTTYQGGAPVVGTVFKLTPPVPPATLWTETVIYRVGARPAADLVFDTSGALYGTTTGGRLPVNQYGTVFKLTPPVPPATLWTETVLYRFQGKLGAGTPLAGLVFDTSGALYGTTSDGGSPSPSYGTVFKLAPPTVGKAPWVRTTLHTFSSYSDGNYPDTRLVFDTSGALYGTTPMGGHAISAFGAVFKLTPPVPPATLWTNVILYAFQGIGEAPSEGDGIEPVAPLIFDTSGALYGTTSNGGVNINHSGNGYGTVFKLVPPVPPATQWTETLLYKFQGGSDGAQPRARLIFDTNGALYGTTSGGGAGSGDGYGTVFKLTPPIPPATTWTETVLYRFQGGNDGLDPEGGLIFDTNGALYGTTYFGGASNCGTVFKIN